MASLNPPISIQIKKGEPHLRGSNIVKTTNKELGKLILSCYLQNPGTARSATSKIFGQESTYMSIYKRDYTASNYRDLIKLETLYKDFCKKGKDVDWASSQFFPAMGDEDRSYIKGLSSHAKYVILAFTVLTVKITKDTEFNFSDFMNDNADIDLQGDIFNPGRSDDFENNLYKLWMKFLKIILETFKSDFSAGNTTGTSNFCKSDITYRTKIVEAIHDATFGSIVFKDELDFIVQDVFKLD